MSAIVGVAGLEATYEAIRQKKRIGLANKEVLVASGRLVMEAAREAGTELIPVDSEHNGAHQCFRAGTRDEVVTATPDRLGRPVSGYSRGRSLGGDAGASPAASNLEDGTPDYDRFGDHDE